MYIDIAAVILLAVIVEIFLPRNRPTVSGTSWEVMGVTGYTVAALGTLLRRRFPRGTLIFVNAIAVVGVCLRASGPTLFYLVLALYSVVAVSSRRVALIVVGIVSADTLAATIAGGGGGAEVVPSVIGSLALLGVGWLAGENTRASRVYARRHADRAAEKAEALEADRTEQVRRAVADERVEIARELHDIVAHAMSVIAVRSGVARMVIDTQPEQAREALTIIETTTRRSLQEMRLLVGVLRDADDGPAALGPAPGLADLHRLVTDMAVAGVQVDLDVEGPVRSLPPAADLSAYRIVQEALTNVVRHAGPTQVRVRIGFAPDEVDIEVVDRGPVCDVPPATMPRVGSGHGLIGMRERAALFGGELDAGPWAGGFRVQTRLHINDLHGSDVRPGEQPTQVRR